MGESTCLMNSLSFPTTMTNQTNNQGNHVHGLGDSVSFGRFTSESLDWDKWSAFPHKRYVEEAKSYAQPGSVAEKKAFFEAHYKRVAAQKAAAAAAALLEQETATTTAMESQVDGTNDHGAHDLEPSLLLNSKIVVDELNQILNKNVAKRNGADKDDPIVEKKIIESVDLKNKENLEDQVSVSEDSRNSQMDRPLLKTKMNTDQEVLQPKIKRKPAIPSFRSTSNGRKQFRNPPSPAKYVASMHHKKENILTPRNKNSNIMENPIEKKKPAPRSLYALMNSGSGRESCKLNPTPPVIVPVKKIENLKPKAPVSCSTPKRCVTPARTPSKVTNVANKKPLATPSVKRRMETPVHPSAVGSKTPGQKWHIFSAVSKSFSAYRNKLQSPTISSPFTLRTEERAARRKQKLEEKFNEKEAQKAQLQTTLKEKAETEFRRLRQSFCFKARPLPSFYNTFETPKSPIKKIDPQAITPSTINPPSSFKKSSRRLWKTNDQNPTTHPLEKLTRRVNHENISPNIHH